MCKNMPHRSFHHFPMIFFPRIFFHFYFYFCFCLLADIFARSFICVSACLLARSRARYLLIPTNSSLRKIHFSTFSVFPTHRFHTLSSSPPSISTHAYSFSQFLFPSCSLTSLTKSDVAENCFNGPLDRKSLHFFPQKNYLLEYRVENINKCMG